MEVFQELGKIVEKSWRDKNYSEDAFPAVAAQALRDFELSEKVSAWDTVKWALGETVLPEQRDLPGRFGDPPITLFNSPRFHIDIYFWLDGTTSIHQHAFCGAFKFCSDRVCTAVTNSRRKKKSTLLPNSAILIWSIANF